MEINFADKGFPLATPIYAAACTIRADSCLQCHPQLLASGSKRFCSGANFVSETSQFHSPTTTPLKLKTPATLTNAMDIEGTYEGGPQESGSVRCETMIECHVALDVHAIPIV